MLLCCAVQCLSGRLFMVLRILLHTKQMSHLKCHMFYNIVKQLNKMSNHQASQARNSTVSMIMTDEYLAAASPHCILVTI